MLQMDEEIGLRAGIPPPLHEAKPLIIEGSDPFRGVDRPALEGRVKVPGCDLLRHDTTAREDLRAQAADPHLEPRQIGRGSDLVRKPAPIWAPVFPAGNEVTL